MWGGRLSPRGRLEVRRRSDPGLHKRAFSLNAWVLSLVSSEMFDSEISGVRYRGGNGGFDDSPFPEPLK